MLKIVVEGFDASGKSTLIKKIEDVFGLKHQKGSGPEVYPGEMDERALRWLDLHGSKDFQVFDRHPCVSHPIYSRFTSVSPLNEAIRRQFYNKPSLIVYCCSPVFKAENHVVKEGESADHVSKVELHAPDMIAQYDAWALEHAHVLYDYSNPQRGANLFKTIGAIREELF